MATIVVNDGLARIGCQASQATGGNRAYSATRHIQVGSVDDQSSAFLSTDQDLDRAGTLTVTNMFDQVLNTPTASANAITHTWTIATGSGNFTIRRIALHDDTTTNVTTASNTLVAGIDGQSLTKTSDFTITFTLILTYTSV